MAENLFENAKKAEKTKKVDNRQEVIVPELEKDLKEMLDIESELAILNAKKQEIKHKLVEKGKENVIKLYNSKKTFPDSIRIKAGKYHYLFITSDRYAQIDKARSEELSKDFNEDLVQENTRFSFNTEILQKYMKHISDLLQKSTKITDEEKKNLITSETSYNVKKGAIKEALSFLEIMDEESLENFFDNIQPVYSIKSVQDETQIEENE